MDGESGATIDRNRSMTRQTQKLTAVVNAALSVLPEELGCDECFEYFSAYAEHKLTGAPAPESSHLVAEHLERCPFCLEEFNVLLESLRAQA